MSKTVLANILYNTELLRIAFRKMMMMMMMTMIIRKTKTLVGDCLENLSVKLV